MEPLSPAERAIRQLVNQIGSRLRQAPFQEDDRELTALMVSLFDKIMEPVDLATASMEPGAYGQVVQRFGFAMGAALNIDLKGSAAPETSSRRSGAHAD